MPGTEHASPPSSAQEEAQPLLAHPVAEREPGTANASSRERTPLPRVQLATIYTIKLVLPVSATQFLPYVNKMVAELIPAGASVGHYSGLLSLSSSSGHFLSIFFWGRLSGTRTCPSQPVSRKDGSSPTLLPPDAQDDAPSYSGS